MLRFIDIWIIWKSKREYFNTSHVTVYLDRMKRQTAKLKFQYISCYGLSQLLIGVYAACANFNTSHVTVYRIAHLQQSLMYEDFNTSHVTVYRPRTILICFVSLLFQYISCYGLSQSPKSNAEIKDISIHLMLQFIDTFCTRYKYIYSISIHLMLRFIHKVATYIVKYMNFNTSHVTVYQRDSKRKTHRESISIHLMLRFIYESLCRISKEKPISIHLMLRFIAIAAGRDTRL